MTYSKAMLIKETYKKKKEKAKTMQESNGTV